MAAIVLQNVFLKKISLESQNCSLISGFQDRYELADVGASLVAQLVKNCLQCRRHRSDSWLGTIPWQRDRLPTPVFLGFLGDSDSKEFACNTGDLCWIPGLGRSLEEGMATHSSILALWIPMDLKRSLVGCSQWGHKELDTAEHTAGMKATISLYISIRALEHPNALPMGCNTLKEILFSEP